MSFLSLSWQMILIWLLVVANGFFVASEFAIVKIRATQLKAMSKSRDWRVPIALQVKRHIYAYLSATQLGITLSSLGLGWIGEPYVAAKLEPHLQQLNITSPTVTTTLALGISFGLITFLHIVLGELAPKSLAIQKPKLVSLWLAPPLMAFYYVFYPFIWVLNGSANLLLRTVGIKPVTESDQGFSPEELQHVLASSRHAHLHDEMINKIMLKALRLKDTMAGQIMLPKEKLTVLWRDKSLKENLLIAEQSGYSRLPLCGALMDEVLGVIHVKELLWQYLALGEQTNILNLIHPVLTFTTKTRLPTMLDLFRNSRNHLAVVIDSEDHMLGIVSFEDVLEELVGDIRDEFDIEKGPYYELTLNSALVDADIPLRDLALETGWPLPTQTNETVEHWCLDRWGKLPTRGEQLKVEGFTIVAEQVSARGLRRVRIMQDAQVAATSEENT
jgi:CBS domain containing-hemolysin-like protein